MKKYILVFSLMLILVNAKAQTNTETIADIQTVCTYYLDGGTNGDSVQFSKAFHPSGQMMYMRNDTLQIVSLKDFMARIRNTGQKGNRTTKIESIQVFGDAAVAKLTIKTETLVLHDFMSLLKTKEGWKIVGKIFSREQKN
jgi:Putative lumazine-binding